MLDKKAFEVLFRAYFSQLCAFSKKFVNDPDEAKEIVHIVFVNLWQKRDEIDTSSPLKSYLFRAVHNRSLNYLRDNKKLVRFQQPLETDQLDVYFESRDYLEENELEQKINTALEVLPEKCREIFMLSRFEGLKYREIADKLEISVKTVETQMTRAMKILREMLIDYLVIFIIFWFL